MDMLKDEISALGEDYFLETLVDTKASFTDLEEEARGYAPVEEVQGIALQVTDSLGDAKAMAELLGITVTKEEGAREALLDSYWSDMGPTFSSADVLELPVYNAPDHSWKVFKLIGEAEISMYRLHPSIRRASPWPSLA
jgi:hypothetical protein